MKFAIVLLATVASIQAGSQASLGLTTTGWTTTPGWTTQPPTTGWTTQGWTTQPPTTGWTTQGWTTTPPPTTGWTTTGWTTQPPTTGWTTQGWSTPGWSGSQSGAGWGNPTTQGWTTQPPTTGWTTQGWTTPGWSGHKSGAGWGNPTTQGWSQPTTSGWGSAPNANIDLTGELASAGSGWAAQNHAESIHVAGSVQNPAELTSFSGGEAVLEQSGDILQYATVNNDGSAASINNVAVAQAAFADESLDQASSGDDISVNSSGWVAAQGEGVAAAGAGSELNLS